MRHLQSSDNDIVHAMADSFLLSLAAMLALAPVAVLAARRTQTRDAVFHLVLAVAVAGPLAKLASLVGAGWKTGLSPALWVTVAASVFIFAALALAVPRVWRLAPLLMPYLGLLAVLAVVWQEQPAHVVLAGSPSVWVALHIGLSIVTYGLLTVAAAAGLAVLLKEGALKAKSTGALTTTLPPIADSERLQVRLLAASAVILAFGVITGMSAQYLQDGRLLSIDHKTVFAVITLALVAGLLGAHHLTGVRGRRAARVVLVAYLCLTLSYTGVKFVTDVVLA